MSIKSTVNVNILFGLLNSEYPNITKDTNFMRYFNSQLERIYNDRYSIGSLQNQNKILLSTCIRYYNENKPMVLKKQKKENINESTFDNYKNSYNKLLNPNKPKDIDFRDTISDEPISNIDNIMNQTLEDREKELQKITNQYNGNNNWLKSTETRETPKLKILDDKKDNEEKKERRVRFEIKEKENNDDVVNLLNKLKKKQDKDVINDENNIITLLNEIKDNQIKILDFIEKFVVSK